jgi:hypothetical protein
MLAADKSASNVCVDKMSVGQLVFDQNSLTNSHTHGILENVDTAKVSSEQKRIVDNPGPTQ